MHTYSSRPTAADLQPPEATPKRKASDDDTARPVERFDQLQEGDRVEAKFTEGGVSWSKGTVQKVSSKGAKKTVIVQFDGRVPANCGALYRL